MLFAIVILGTAAALFVVYFAPHIQRYRKMQEILPLLCQRRSLVLTFDDGPSPELTSPLLDLLAARNVKATFFVLGRNAQNYPELVDRIVRDGHDLGCHGFDHVSAWCASPWRAVKDISDGFAALRAWLPPNGLFRPPHGRLTLATWLALRRRRAPVWWWTLDSGDTHKHLPSTISVVSAAISTGGGIVLLHDNARSDDRHNFVLSVTENLIDAALDAKITIESLKAACP